MDPSNPTNTAIVLRELPEDARALGLEIQVLNAGTIPEIDEAFASLARAQYLRPSLATCQTPSRDRTKPYDRATAGLPKIWG